MKPSPRLSRSGLRNPACTGLGIAAVLVLGLSSAGLAKDPSPSTATPSAAPPAASQPAPSQPAKQGSAASSEPGAGAERGPAPAGDPRGSVEAGKPGEALVIDFKLLKTWVVEAVVEAPAPADAASPSSDSAVPAGPTGTVNGSGAKPSEKPSEKLADKPSEKPTGKPTDKPTEAPQGKPQGDPKQPAEAVKPAESAEGAKPADAPLPAAPAAVKALSGKRVRLSGFMIPLDLEEEKCREFVLVPVVPSCFYCTPPGLNEFVVVRMKDKKPASFSENAVLVTGVLEVGEERVDNVVTSLFRMTGEVVREAGPGAAPGNERS